MAYIYNVYYCKITFVLSVITLVIIQYCKMMEYLKHVYITNVMHIVYYNCIYRIYYSCIYNYCYQY